MFCAFILPVIYSSGKKCYEVESTNRQTVMLLNEWSYGVELKPHLFTTAAIRIVQRHLLVNRKYDKIKPNVINNNNKVFVAYNMNYMFK